MRGLVHSPVVQWLDTQAAEISLLSEVGTRESTEIQYPRVKKSMEIDKFRKFEHKTRK